VFAESFETRNLRRASGNGVPARSPARILRSLIHRTRRSCSTNYSRFAKRTGFIFRSANQRQLDGGRKMAFTVVGVIRDLERRLIGPLQYLRFDPLGTFASLSLRE
jgi:hypothetical protein